jgi:hypothetical protein
MIQSDMFARLRAACLFSTIWAAINDRFIKGLRNLLLIAGCSRDRQKSALIGRRISIIRPVRLAQARPHKPQNQTHERGADASTGHK